MASVKRVLLVGGGIAGMTLATAPQRSGIDAAIVEINPTWSVIWIGISVQGATLRVLRSIGVLDRCVASGADPVGVLARANAALRRLCSRMTSDNQAAEAAQQTIP